MTIFDHFTALDGLVQVIYQDKFRFVLLSRVHHPSSTHKNKSSTKSGDKGKQPATDGTNEFGWQIYVGLADEGRWWCGWWREADVKALTGPKPSAALLSRFATNLAQTIVKGELFVSNAKAVLASEASTSKDEPMKLVFGPTSSKPLDMGVTELSIEDIGYFSARELFTIAVSAQSRGCRILAVKEDASAPSKPSGSKRAPSPVASQDRKPSAATSDLPSTSRKRKAKIETEAEELDRLRRELTIAKRQLTDARAEAERLAAQVASDPEDKPVLLRPNLYRRLRPLRTMEFVSDDET